MIVFGASASIDVVVVPEDLRFWIITAKESPHSASRVDVAEVFSNFLDFATRLATAEVVRLKQLDWHY